MSIKKVDVVNDANATQEQLSAWERWQLPNMDLDVPHKSNAYNVASPRSVPASHTQPEAEEQVIQPLTAEALEAISTAAYEEGYQLGIEAGKADGFKAGFSNGEAEIKSAMTRMGQITRVLLEPIPKQDEELEKAILEMVEKVCKRIVHRELLLNSEGVVAVVREVLDCLNPGAQRIRIHLNPADAALVTAQLRAAGELEDGWRILPHPTITPGGCIVETDTSLIDARAEKRLASVLQKVYEQQKNALEKHAGQQGNVDQLLGEMESFAIDDSAADGTVPGLDVDPMKDDPDDQLL